MQSERIVAEFSQQAESFNASAVARAAQTLDGLVRLAAPEPGDRWLEAACGPGLVSRKLAPLVREVHGIDMTPAMVEVARREAAAAGVSNATFSVGDATATERPAASVDGAVARFTIHHVPVPARLFDELARVVRPGGSIVLADHVADVNADAVRGLRRSSGSATPRIGLVSPWLGSGRSASARGLSSSTKRWCRLSSISRTGWSAVREARACAR